MKYAHQSTQIIHENYPIIIRLSVLISLLIVTSLFLFIPRVISQYLLITQVTEIDIEQVDIPMTEQLELPPPPARPSVPIESESAEISEDLTTDETTFESFDPLTIQPPPPFSNGPNVKFVPYDSPPVPIGGYASIQKRIEYPEIAQEAGIDGRVIAQVLFAKESPGNVEINNISEIRRFSLISGFVSLLLFFSRYNPDK